MPTTAQSIVDKAQIILQDTLAVRWPEPELLGWLNDGQREIASLRPDSTNVQTTLNTVAGAKQTLPLGATALVDVLRNVGGNAIRRVSRELMDAQRPGWYNDTGAPAKHFMYDPRTPRVFHVWPPSSGAQQLELKYQAVPADVSLGQNISLGDEFANVLLDYILFRAYQKDADFAPNDARTLGARQLFENGLGLKAAADAAAQPANRAEA